MKIHEYQAKKLLERYKVRVPDQIVVSSVDQARHFLKENKWTSAVVKVQVHAGGRGKAGGVIIAKSYDDIIKGVEALLGKKIVNEQTGPAGLVSHLVIISPLTEIVQEYYLSLAINRELAEIVLIASAVGGVDIEQTAHEHPDKVLLMKLPEEGAFRGYQLHQLAKWMGWQGITAKEGIGCVQGLVKAFFDLDASMIEINPLIKDSFGHLIALDAKITLDENALFRHPDLKELFDRTQVPENEALAQEHDLAYVSLEGDIGCMVNGAGLAMATMDIIHHFGGKPANFLDVGGSATKEKVAEGFKIILLDPHVKAILINIFGGIMNCETLAAGIKDAISELQLHLPIVVRMEGTNVDEGKKIFQESGVNITLADDLTDAAKKVVSMASK